MLLSPLFKYIAGGLAFVTLLLALGLAMERRHSAKLKAQLDRTVEARAADRRAYESAQALAAERNRATVARVEAQQERISADVESNLNARLERLRRELRQAPPAASGSAGGAGVSANGEAPGGVAPEARMCLAPADVLRAAENEERHDRLIDWVERQLQVQ